MARKDCCFLCRFLSKSDTMGCELDDSVVVDIWNIMGDIKEVIDCPLKKEGGITMEYKGFTTTNVVKERIEGTDVDVYSAVVENSSRYLKFDATSLEDIVGSFHKCIDDYLVECKKLGINPFQTR